MTCSPRDPAPEAPVRSSRGRRAFRRALRSLLSGTQGLLHLPPRSWLGPTPQRLPQLSHGAGSLSSVARLAPTVLCVLPQAWGQVAWGAIRGSAWGLLTALPGPWHCFWPGFPSAVSGLGNSPSEVESPLRPEVPPGARLCRSALAVARSHSWPLLSPFVFAPVSVDRLDSDRKCCVSWRGQCQCSPRWEESVGELRVVQDTAKGRLRSALLFHCRDTRLGLKAAVTTEEGVPNLAGKTRCQRTGLIFLLAWGFLARFP